MSTTATPPPPAPAPAPPPQERNEITIVSHSNLFYWWPVWAVGILIGTLSYFDGHLLAVVPNGSTVYYDADIEVPQGGGDTLKLKDHEVIVLPASKNTKGKEEHKKRQMPEKDPESKQSAPAPLRLHMADQAGYGVLWATVLLLVIVITNVPLRGMWSVLVISTIILLSVIFSAYGMWDTILRTLHLLDIRINTGGYFFISLVLFVIWLVTILLFDRQMYMIFTPGQLKVCTEIGGGEKVFDVMGLSLEKQRSDLFRHWILGLGSGDLVVKTSGAQAQHFDLPNVLFIGKKVRMIEEMLQKKKVVESK